MTGTPVVALVPWTRPAALAAALCGVFYCAFWCGGCGEGGASEPSEAVPRADLVRISIAGPGENLERPAVQFPHDAHTETLAAENADCGTCHLTRQDEYLSPLYMRLDGPTASADSALGGDELMKLYHDNCTDCHVERKDADKKSGPVICGGCHLEKPEFVLTRAEIGMDQSLHYRHSKARNEKCEDCHHIYDAEAGKLVYEKGTESSCRDCHLESTVGDTVSFEIAAHWDCISCHMETAESAPDAKTGPKTCGGCHDQRKQREIEVVEDAPRIKRGQPDFVLLSAPENELEYSRMGTVPFSHVEHEDFLSTCRACHHHTLKACNECHTLEGTERSQGVTLQQAMHGMTSDHSCVGCHDDHKSAIECAGCHGLMESGRLSEHACGICHAGPPPWDLEKERGRYTSLDDFRPESSEVKLSFTVSEIPDSVVIGVLSREYEPAVMPHRKIINTLERYIENSKLAIHFHGHEDVVCQGCHHHGSIGEKPALCENCHGRPFDVRNLYRPGLYAAFHRQCLGCHRLMAMEKPSECSGCHKKKAEVDLSEDILPGIVRE